MTAPQWRAALLAKRTAGQYAVLTVAAPGSPQCRPGQFASLAVAGESGLLLRRQAWIGEVSPRGREGGTMDVVVDPREPGGRRLAACEQGSEIDVIAPLGRPFSLPRDPLSTVLVATGTATATLVPLARTLVDRGCRVQFVVLADEPPYDLLNVRRVAAVAITPDPGHSAAAVTGLLGGDVDLVYSAGPADVLAGVAAAAARAGVVHQTALRTELVCGAGSCMACVVPVRGHDGLTRMVRSCVEGPVLDAGMVRWDQLGRVPADCLGAAADAVVSAGAAQ